MPGPYVTSTGLAIPTAESLLVDIVADLRALVDPLIDTDAEEVMGQTNGIFASALREAYEVLEVASNALDPDAVEDVRVDVLMSLTGSQRQAATKSSFAGTRRLVVDLDAATTLPLGTLFEVEGLPLIKFETTEIVVSVAADEYLVTAESTVAGRVVVNAATLIVITTPVIGLNSVTNPFDAIPGSETDSDAEALVRRENELDTLGSGTPAAIRAHLLAYEIDGDHPVLEATIFENDQDAVDALGLPGHSMEALVYDGLGADAEDDAIAQVIWDHKPGGTYMHGSESGTATDENGDTHTVRFTRPTQVGVDVDVTINTDAATYAGAQAVYDAWSAFTNAVPPGNNEEDGTGEVKFSKAMQAILAVEGVEGIETIRLRVHSGTYQAAFTDLLLGPRDKPFADATVSYCTITVA